MSNNSLMDGFERDTEKAFRHVLTVPSLAERLEVAAKVFRHKEFAVKALAYADVDNDVTEDEAADMVSDLFRRCAEAAGRKTAETVRQNWFHSVGEIIGPLSRTKDGSTVKTLMDKFVNENLMVSRYNDAARLVKTVVPGADVEVLNLSEMIDAAKKKSGVA